MRRVKRRYLLIKAVSEGPVIAPEELRQRVLEELERIGGWLARAEAAVTVKRKEASSGKFILKCSLKSLPVVLLATTMVGEVGGKRVRLDVLRISGTIKGLNES